MMWNKVNNEQKAKPKIILPKMSHYDLLIKNIAEKQIEKPNKNIIYTLHYGLNNNCRKNSAKKV